MRRKNFGFTLAEVLIVIGIIGVVAALTLPNLNHATGDKETVTRLQKAYSILSEANDRAVAIYGPISTWMSNPEFCDYSLENCWFRRVGEFLKISKSCNEYGDSESDNYVSCVSLESSFGDKSFVMQLPDGITIAEGGNSWDDCTGTLEPNTDICLELYIDINGPSKGKNKKGIDIFAFDISDSLGLTYQKPNEDFFEGAIQNCAGDGRGEEECTWWVLENGNLDYLKADESADGGVKCNNSNIILDGTTNTSCH